jgi:hypothetical protein
MMDPVRYEPAHRGVNLSVAISRLLMDKEPLRHDQIQVIFCPLSLHIEAFALFDFFRVLSPYLTVAAAVTNIQYPNGVHPDPAEWIVDKLYTPHRGSPCPTTVPLRRSGQLSEKFFTRV